MRQQATHKGICQICGRTQKLPGGQMAKHGYTVNWGFFNGICAGSGSLPFEQDKSLVDEAIRGAKVHQDNLVRRIADLKADTEPAKAYVRYYSKHSYRYESAWVDTSTMVKGEAGKSHSGQWIAPVTDRTGEHTASFGYSSYRNDTANKAAHEANVRRADEMERDDLKGVTDYIAWQTYRLKNWCPQPLRTIEEASQPRATVSA